LKIPFEDRIDIQQLGDPYRILVRRSEFKNRSGGPGYHLSCSGQLCDQRIGDTGSEKIVGIRRRQRLEWKYRYAFYLSKSPGLRTADF
jgi:hypothetical protein